MKATTRTNMRSSPRTLLFLALAASSWASPQTVPTSLFNPGYLAGDCSYHSITAASDGMLYFTVCTHHPEKSARIYRFDPKLEAIRQIGDLGEILGEDPQSTIPHGKIHTDLIEHDGYLYFSTHTSYYDGNLPRISPSDRRAPYPGGHFMRFHLETGVFEDLAQLNLPNEGIITMTVDQANDTLYGLTWPTGLLLSYNLDEKLLHNWGAVQGRGEWGRLAEEWDFICRKLAIDEGGNLYGATDTGQIWHFEKGKQRPVDFLEDLNLRSVAPVQETAFEIPAEPHFFWNNWRTILWNPTTESFWGLQGGSTQLFEFKPSSGTLHSVHSLRADGVSPKSRRNPFRSQLGLMLGPQNTLIYLAHGPGIESDGKEDLDTSVHLLTYDIESGERQDHGALTTQTGQRIFFTESVEIGLDDHLYTVAWVESNDPARMEAIQAARAKAAPDETDELIYEMQLVKLPRWQEFIE